MPTTDKQTEFKSLFNEEMFYIGKIDRKSLFFTHIAGITFPDPRYHIVRRASRILSMEYVICGKGTIRFGDKSFRVEKDDIYFLPPHCDHDYHSDPEEPFKKIWFNVGGALTDSLLELYGLRDIGVCHVPSAFSYFERIVELCRKNSSPDRTDDSVAIVFHELLQHLHSRLFAQSGGASGDALTIRNYLDSHSSERLTLNLLASLISKSVPQMLRIFKSEFGTTPYDYLLDYRLSQARDLLLNTNLPIKEIAFLSGFNDEHYFSTRFKLKYDVTPKECRRSPQ